MNQIGNTEYRSKCAKQRMISKNYGMWFNVHELFSAIIKIERHWNHVPCTLSWKSASKHKMINLATIGSNRRQNKIPRTQIHTVSFVYNRGFSGRNMKNALHIEIDTYVKCELGKCILFWLRGCVNFIEHLLKYDFVNGSLLQYPSIYVHCTWGRQHLSMLKIYGIT